MAGNGIPYFPLDCQLDEKFELLEAEFGIKGYGVVIKLFSRIYGGDGGYYCVWNDEVALLFASKVGVNINLVSEILRAAIRRGIFDEGMYHRYGILTSTGIQRRYFKAYRRRSALKIVEDYLLINVRNFEPIACKKAKIVSNSGGNVCSFEQSKEKKRKEEKSISPAGFAEEVIALFNDTCESLPRASYTPWRRDAIAALDVPLDTFEEVFTAAEKSDYLSGRSDEWVSCGLDWLLKPENFQKVLEGTYDRRKSERRKDRMSGHAQRRYSPEELKCIGIDLLDKDAGGNDEV